MPEDIVKRDIRIVYRHGLAFVAGPDGRVRKDKPWLSGPLAVLYDLLMTTLVFPRKLEADRAQHYSILSNRLRDIHAKRVVEIGTGSGDIAHLLPSDNRYTGSDISPALLKIASRKLRRNGFDHIELHVASADTLPFADNAFDICICVLVLDFLPDTKMALGEITRILTPGGKMLCCVPVPERKRTDASIRGTLHAEFEFERLCDQCGLAFRRLAYRNGSLLYFEAQRRKPNDVMQLIAKPVTQDVP